LITKINWLKIWALFDIASVINYILISYFHDRVPFYNDFLISLQTSESYENYLPAILVFLGLLLYASLPFSAWLLFKGRKLGIWFVYLQTPLRIISVVPSVFFIGWLRKVNDSELMPILIMALFLSTEIYKLYTVYTSHRIKPL